MACAISCRPLSLNRIFFYFFCPFSPYLFGVQVVPESKAVAKVSASTADICEYVVGINSEFGGLADGLSPVDGGVTFHHACHAQARDWVWRLKEGGWGFVVSAWGGGGADGFFLL